GPTGRVVGGWMGPVPSAGAVMAPRSTGAGRPSRPFARPPIQKPKRRSAATPPAARTTILRFRGGRAGVTALSYPTMDLQTVLPEALGAMAANKLRTALTMLVIMIGIPALICTVAIG